MTCVISVTEDREICFRLRFEVFVEEQGVPVDEEIDALDDTATHLLAFRDDSPIGTARIVFDAETAKIGRVCVTKAGRGTGLGKALIEKAVEIAKDTPGITRAKLGAQVQALGFYEKLGFAACGPVYDDAGIDHRDMVLEL
jgi:predicted GNAT family N-acyltransferase